MSWILWIVVRARRGSYSPFPVRKGGREWRRCTRSRSYGPIPSRARRSKRSRRNGGASTRTLTAACAGILCRPTSGPPRRCSTRSSCSPPTATVEAGFSKRRRRDRQVLHPALAQQLSTWIATKPDLAPDTLLFPVSGRVPGGLERKTHKMMQRDLAVAREKWIEEAETKKERAVREKSDFLAYCNHAGLYADFHSCRHLFITSLERAGVRPKVAQKLARHSDIRLTLGVYTHAELADQTAAMEALPGPPNAKSPALPAQPELCRNLLPVNASSAGRRARTGRGD